LVKQKEPDPILEPTRWIKKRINWSSRFGISTKRCRFIDPYGKELDDKHYIEFYVHGNKLKHVGINDGSVIFVTTKEYRDKYLGMGKLGEHPVILFSDGNIAQLAWTGTLWGINDSSAWKACTNDLHPELGVGYVTEEGLNSRLLQYDKEDPGVVAFKYPESKYKEWNLYKRSDILGIVVYSYKI